jgi:predicted transposase YbfD/YdcC
MQAAGSIFEHFQQLSDPRLDRGKNHSLYEMVVVALTAAMSGANCWADVERFGKARIDWFEKFLTLEYGMPSHDTFGRVFARLDTDEFLTCLQNWLGTLHMDMQGQGVAIDGKTLRRSFDNATGVGALHVVNAWATGLRICLGQVAVDGKSNEITAVPKLLEFLELQGAVVTLDAMHCQTETARVIVAQGADYVLTVKGNQPTLHQRLAQLFVDDGLHLPSRRRHVTVEKSHGREERREYYVSPAPADLRSKWKGLQSVGMVRRWSRDVVSGKVHEEIMYFISSLPPKVRALAKHVRGHWSVENTLHWCLDVTFGEDASRIRKGTGAEIASIFRRLALTILQRDTTQKENIRGKRLMAGWNTDVLEQILLGFQAI